MQYKQTDTLSRHVNDKAYTNCFKSNGNMFNLETRCRG